MIRWIKYLFLIAVAACLVIVALANRQMVTLSLLTPELATATNYFWQIDVPLYVVGLGGVALGLLIGFVWEWLREMKHRSEVTKRQAQVRKLKREVIKLKGEQDEGKDEVLALLESPPKKAG